MSDVTPTVDPMRFVPTGAIIQTSDGERYIVLKPNPKNLLSERERDGQRFNIPRSYPFAIVGQKDFKEMFAAPDIEPHNIVMYVGPKFENKLMVVVTVDSIAKTLSLADIDEPRKRLSRVPFANVEKKSLADLVTA